MADSCLSAEEPLKSTFYEVDDALAANELFQRNRWTDGLPIVPPTESAVRPFLEAAALAPPDHEGMDPRSAGDPRYLCGSHSRVTGSRHHLSSLCRDARMTLKVLDPRLSSCSLHDEIEGERLGMPAVAVMTSRFEPAARAVAQLNGLPGYAFALIAHPIANNDDDALRAKAKSALRTIVELLTTRDR